MKLSAVFIAKPKEQQLEDLVFSQDTVNDIITFQWEFSVLKKPNSKNLIYYGFVWKTERAGAVFIKLLLVFGLLQVTNIGPCSLYFGIFH